MRQKITSALSELQVDLQDMQATIDIAIKDPAKFQLTPSDLMTRQEFVRDLQAQANDAQEELGNSAMTPARGLNARASAQSQDRQSLLTSSTRVADSPFGDSASGSSLATERADAQQHRAWEDNEASINSQQQQQQEIMRDQDLELGTMGNTLDRLGSMGKTIQTTLKQQGAELDAFAEEVDDASGRMTAATALMKKMLKKKDSGKFCCIFILTIVFIILMYMVIAW
jgi:hypothetical protein